MQILIYWVTVETYSILSNYLNHSITQLKGDNSLAV